MKYIVSYMDKQQLGEYAELFMNVFNAEPWNDSWTAETASLRIGAFMNDNSFFGMELRESGSLVGIIFGQWEHYFDGKYFRMIEFCIDNEKQGQGCGKRLLDAFKKELVRQGAVNVFLITQHGERTEGWYKRQGFKTGENEIIMNLAL